MLETKYQIAITETLYYLNGIKQEDIDKIPRKFMTFLKENASKNYKCKFDYTKPLKDMEITNEARGLIAVICLNYWCDTESQKNSFIKYLKENEIKYQEDLKKIYDISNIFNKNLKNKKL